MQQMHARALRICTSAHCPTRGGCACRLEPTDLVGFSSGVNYTFTLTAGFAGSTAVSTASTVRLLLPAQRAAAMWCMRAHDALP